MKQAEFGCHCLSQGGTFRRMQTKSTPVLSAVRRNELPKNKIGLRGNGLDGKKIKCVERLRQLSILKVLVNQDRDVHVHECDFWLSQS